MSSSPFPLPPTPSSPKLWPPNPSSPFLLPPTSSSPKLWPPAEEINWSNVGQLPTSSQQGYAMTCVAHSLAKCVCSVGERRIPKIDFRQDEAIAQCVQLGREKVVTSGVSPDALTQPWKNQHTLLQEGGNAADTPEGYTYKATFTEIKKCSSKKYDVQKEHILVIFDHCVYVIRKDETYWYFWDSHGPQDTESENTTWMIEIERPGNQLYQVDVFIEDVSPSNHSPTGPGAKMFQGPTGPGCEDVPVDETDEENDERMSRMREIIIERIKAICVTENSFDETFAKDIGRRTLQIDYQLWKKSAGINKSLKLQIEDILHRWEEQNGLDATPRKMYLQMVELSKRDKNYITIRDHLKRNFQF